jgi:hypothetical protein
VIVQPVSSARSEIATLYVGKLSSRIPKTSYSWRCDVDDHSADANELLGRVPEAFREVQGTTQELGLLGASGLGQVFEIVQQLRGTCGRRQVDGARVGLMHALGAGGNCSVLIFRRQ